MAIMLCFYLKAQQFSNPKVEILDFHIEEGICYFNGLKIGHKKSDIESKLGSTNLVSDDEDLVHLFYPEYGLKFGLEGDYVREIELYPNPQSVMGSLLKFKIFSRNRFEWKFGDLAVSHCQPQDIMTSFGTENLTTKMGVGFAGSINDTMTYQVVNSGGTQEVVFFFIDSKEMMNHIENRLGGK